MTLAIQKLSRRSFDGGGVKFWAWTVSILVHLIVLTAFGTVRFSKLRAKDRQLPVPVAKVSRIKKLTRASPIVPKPKIKRLPASTNKIKVVKKAQQLSPSQIFETAKPDLQNLENWKKPSASMNVFSLAQDVISQRPVEFFGSFTDRRKICYVVDCSGSMRGIFGRVQKKLSASIETLQPDQYFYIIFFGGDKLFEFGDSRLVRANERTKSAAYNFVDSVRPAGRTNAMAALERALQIRDGTGVGPSIVYFLTDGFELANEDAREFSQKVTGLLRQFAPATRINTIGFWPQQSDRWILKEIARQSGGECVFINE